jgi:hypothetical protein
MRRIGLAVVLALSLNLAPLSAEGQQKLYRIGFVGSSGIGGAYSDAFYLDRQRGR